VRVRSLLTAGAGWLALVGGACWLARAAASWWLPPGGPVDARYQPLVDGVVAALYRSGPLWLGLALLGLSRRLSVTDRGLTAAGALVAVAASVAGLLNVLAVIALAIAPSPYRPVLWVTGFVAFTGLLCATPLLGLATLASRALGRWSALPLGIGLLGPSLILLAPFVRAAGHRWFTSDVPLAVMGAGWVLLGLVLLTRSRLRPQTAVCSPEKTRGAA